MHHYTPGIVDGGGTAKRSPTNPLSLYLDHSATTPPCPEAIAAMVEVLGTQWGNPSSLHQWGDRSATVVEMARCQVAALIGADPTEVVFTGGGTESDNWALMGVAHQYREPRHMIISSVEHSAIAKTADFLETQGWAITRLPVNRDGLVTPASLAAALRPETVLVSIIHGQSEVGTIQPLKKLGAIAREAGVLFHGDAVQTVGRVPIDVAELPVDLLSLSSHKIYGPQGAGALYVRSGVKLQPLLFGGSQEGKLRAGTQAVAAIAGFGAAAEQIAQNGAQEAQRLVGLRDRLIQGLRGSGLQLTGYHQPGDRTRRLAHHGSFCLDLRHWPDPPQRPSGRDLVRQLNRASIAVSSGSACNSGTLSPSPVLSAMGYGTAEAIGALRITLGRSTQPKDIDWTILAVQQVLQRLGCRPAPETSLSLGSPMGLRPTAIAGEAP